jgi:hypothetical protein
MKKTTVRAAVSALTLGLAAVLLLSNGSVSDRAAAAPQPIWTEAPWPYPVDQWGLGKAFVCKAADCGTTVTVLIRAKVGFCNCSTGVADDEELDRVSDFELLGNQAKPEGPGRPIMVGWMKGRSRTFNVTGTLGAKLSALSIGFNDRCDAIIATAVAAPDRAATIEPAVLEFLNSRTILGWAEVTLGL